MLVGGFSFNHLGKMSSSMGRIIPLWKVLTTSKNMKVSWDSYSQIFPIYWEKKIFQTTNQLYINAGYMELS